MIPTITLIVPPHTQEKLDKLSSYYMIPADMIIQKIIVDRVDDIHEAVLLEPARKERSV